MGMGMGGMYGGMGNYGAMGMPWIMSLNQFLFGIQSVVFSLGQAVQIVGMNAQQIRHVYESVKGMVENAVGQVHKWGSLPAALEGGIGAKGDGARRWMMGDDDAGMRRGGVTATAAGE